MIPRLIVSILLLLQLTASNAIGQLISDNLVNYTDKDGVPAAQVQRLLVDRSGYIWVGTINGLARFDGYEFKRFLYNPNNTNSISGSIITTLFEESNGRIWIGTLGKLNIYDPSTDSFKRYSYDHLVTRSVDRLTRPEIIVEDSKGRVIIGISEFEYDEIADALLYYDKATDEIKVVEAADSLNLNNIVSAVVDRDDNVWILSYSGFFKLDKDNNITEIDFSRVDIPGEVGYAHSLAIDSKGIIWAPTTRSVLLAYDPVTSDVKYFSLAGLFPGYNEYFDIFRAAVDREDNIWLGSEHGLIFFDRDKESFEIFENESENQLERAAIIALKIDSFGTLWFGTLSNGLLKYDENTVFDSYSFQKDNPNSMPEGWAAKIIEDRIGNVWISTAQFASSFTGMARLDLSNNSIRRYFTLDLVPDAWFISGIYEYRHNEFYIGTNQGVFRFNPDLNSAIAINFKELPDNSIVNEFHEDRNGDFWVCTANGIYRRKSGETEFRKFDLAIVEGGDANSNEVTKLFESDRNGLWLISNNGLFLYDPKSGQTRRHAYEIEKGDVFLSQDINSFYEDEEGVAWVGGWQGGLSRYDLETRSIKTYMLEDGLPSMNVQGILGDDKNNDLWLSTFEGIVRFNKQEEIFTTFSVNDGIQSQQFADGAYLKTSSGYLVFGGSNGITVFNPDDIVENLDPPKVLITRLKLSNTNITPGDDSPLKKSIIMTDEIVLTHDQNDISLEYTAIHYSNPAKNTYAYKLENYEDDWRYVGTQRTAIYPNLPHGKYTFKVKASNNNDVWNEEGASLSIIINPPWWKTLWAYGAYSVLFVVMLGGVRKVELKRRHEKEKKRLLQLENDRKTKELEEARQLQLSMLPRELPDLPHLDIAVYMQTATEVGGDYYDFHLDLDGTLTVVLGDATGHGLKAGTMVTAAKSLFNSYASNTDITYTFSEMTRCIKQMHLRNLSMCMTMLKINGNNLTISSAGMPPTYVAFDKHVKEFEFNAMPLGSIKEFPYELKNYELKAGDTILLMSDGYPELMNSNREIFGYNRARQSFESASHKSPDEIILSLKDEGLKWLNGEEPDDDVTFVVIKVK